MRKNLLQHLVAARRSPRGFTIIELLVVIAILALLMGLVFVALRTGRRSGERAESLNALRQVTAGYLAYATEYNGRLMPGYVDPADLTGTPPLIDLKARLRNGVTLAPGDTSSYVWRLAPYLDHKWDVFMSDYRDKQLVAGMETEYGDGSTSGVFGPATVGANQLGIGRVPSYGLNSLYLGGDNVHGPVDRSPWANLPGGSNPNTIAAQRLSDVKNPNKIIVFGASRLEGNLSPAVPATLNTPDKPLGYCELRAPFANFDPTTQTGSDAQWSIDTTTGPTAGQIIFNGTNPAGVPISRLNDDRVPISHLDGSVEAEFLARLAGDMSRWSPKALSTH